jgi:hypothetical protein
LAQGRKQGGASMMDAAAQGQTGAQGFARDASLVSGARSADLAKVIRPLLLKRHRHLLQHHNCDAI